MKKLFFFILLIASLTGCASGIDEPEPVQLSHLKQPLCVTGNLQKAPEDFSETILTSLKKRGVQARFAKSSELADCASILKVNVRGNRAIVARAKLTVVQDKQVIGSVAYKRRGDEVERVKQVGLQGQTDLMINELFK
ncbi:lipoprotein [Gallibacterium anatis]|uniref:lipoprotein n=1 Tax=Gallibacterium anatis TaxID=750 RepID=UPI003004D692